MMNPIVQIVNILANDQKQELVMQKGWPDGVEIIQNQMNDESICAVAE